MQIAFSPALGSSSSISLPAPRIRFTAVLDRSAYYDHIKRSAGVLQLWSDAPVQGRSNGEWGPVSFELSKPTLRSTYDDEDVDLSLVLNESEELDFEEGKSFLLELSLTEPTMFSFTYRILYPSGGVWWLGEFGRNGIITVDHSAERFGPLELVGGSKLQQNDAGSYQWTSRVENKAVVGKVNQIDDHTVWSVGQDLAVNSGTQKDALLFLLVPHKSHVHPLVPSAPVMIGSLSGGLLSLARDGVLSSTGSFILQLLDTAEDFSSFLSQLPSTSRPRVLTLSDHTAAVAFRRKSTYESPISVLIFPISTPAGAFSLDLDLSSLGASPLALYSPDNSRSHLVSSTTAKINAPSTGTSLVASFAYALPEETGHVVFTTETLVSSPPEEEKILALPTPPPSPPPKLYQSFAVAADTIEAEKESISNEDLAPAEESVPAEEKSVEVEEPSVAAQVDEAENTIETAPSSPEPPSYSPVSALILHPNSPNVLQRSFFAALLAAIARFFGTFFAYLLGRGWEVRRQGGGVKRIEYDNEKEKKEEKHVEDEDHDEITQEVIKEEEAFQEPTPTIPEATPEPEVADPVLETWEKPDEVIEPPPEEAVIAAPQPNVPPVQTLPTQVNGIFFDVPKGSTTLLVFSPTSQKPALTIKLDDQAVPVVEHDLDNSVRKLSLDVTGEKGGKLGIFLAEAA